MQIACLIICCHFVLQLFYDLRQRLDLSTENIPLALVGLRTLLEGTQAELRIFTHNIHRFLGYNTSFQDTFRNRYPDFYQPSEFRKEDLPAFVKPWINIQLMSQEIPLMKIKHSIFNVALMSETKYIFDVIMALFDVLNSPDLLTNFQTIAEQMLPEQQGSQDVNSANQAVMVAIPVQPQNFHAYSTWFWLKVIGGGNTKQLRYFLNNMLLFTTIPRLIGQLLEYERSNRALKIAQQISETDDFTRAASAFPENMPNYFEFIVIYVTI
ncbi:hypothetical protein H4R34_003816 [Dimargaris verticillata]|uniref:Uncharacterized protein n=1 Tax=Dimargaris verticillata TaxID=2761393 RepID=A0A9W8ECT3_9FUNG|nr:hypothetical protein H4R34_003816 [Dimargaris verticillata]